MAGPFDVEKLLGRLNDVEKRNAPPHLFTAGDSTLLQWHPRVSIVGTRMASVDGAHRARALAAALARHGVIVVSGLAEGIDTAAHESAIAAGGRTIAVLGTSLDETYPPKNRALQETIMREHLAVSQFATGVPSRRANFPMRNRTMALISDATVIVEAGAKSGTEHQGWEALRLGRPLFLMDALLADKSIAWTSELLRYGAEELRADKLEHIFEFLPEKANVGTAELAF